MRYKSRRSDVSADADMTPMIDMSFQLIAFFMILINFSDMEVNERIKLPSSILAKPPETAQEHPITVQLVDRQTVFFGGQQVTFNQLGELLANERSVLEYREESLANATIVIRADAGAKTGLVQEVIEVCQRGGFENFVLRARQED